MMTLQETSVASSMAFLFLLTTMTSLTTLTILTMMTSQSEAKNTDCFSRCLKLCTEFNGDFNQVVHQLPRFVESAFESGPEPESNEGPKSVFEQEFSPVGKRSWHQPRKANELYLNLRIEISWQSFRVLNFVWYKTAEGIIVQLHWKLFREIWTHANMHSNCS